MPVTAPFLPAFTAAGADRRAPLRKQPAAIDRMLATGADSGILPIWRGKPLLAATDDGGDRAGWLPPGHPALAGAESWIYLGETDGTQRLACDLSAWQPGPGQPDPESGFFDASEQHHPDCPPGWRFAELRGAMMRLSPAEANLAVTAKALTGWHSSHGFCAACGVATVSAQAGWQRDCPGCGRSHFPRTDPVVIMLVTRGNRVLLGRSPGWPDGMYSLLAGFVEPGETIETAVRREVAEETGIEVGAVRYLECQPWPFPSSLMLGCAAAAVTDTITVDPDELEDALWLRREDLVEVFAGTHLTIRTPRPGAIAGVLLRRWLADSGV